MSNKQNDIFRETTKEYGDSPEEEATRQDIFWEGVRQAEQGNDYLEDYKNE